MALDLSAADARALALRAQGLVPGVLPLRSAQVARASQARKVAAVDATLRHLGAVQLDTISVLARSHELVPYARLGAVGREAVETAYWGGGSGHEHPDEATTFEYWSHAACILPVEEWPWFAYRRRSYARSGIRWHEVPTQALEGVLDRLRDDGPLTTTQLGGAKRSAEWWDWSETKIAVEWLLDIGQVVCVRRVGWRRVYDLAERAIPAQHRVADATWVDVDGVHGPSDDACVRELLLRSARVCGVGTLGDLVDVHRLIARHVPRAIVEAQLGGLVHDGVLTPVDVEGWGQQAYADSAALAAFSAGPRLSADPGAGAGSASGSGWGRSRTTLLSPFDSLVWHRGRTSRLFGFDYQLEAYVPAAKRVHGYFTDAGAARRTARRPRRSQAGRHHAARPSGHLRDRPARGRPGVGDRRGRGCAPRGRVLGGCHRGGRGPGSHLAGIRRRRPHRSAHRPALTEPRPPDRPPGVPPVRARAGQRTSSPSARVVQRRTTSSTTGSIRVASCPGRAQTAIDADPCGVTITSASATHDPPVISRTANPSRSPRSQPPIRASRCTSQAGSG